MSWHVEVCRYCSLEALSRESHWSDLGFGQGLQPSGALSHCFLMHGSEAENAIYITPLAKSQVIMIYVGLKTHMACTHHGSGEWSRHHCTVNECRCHLQHYKLKMAWGQGGYLVELLPPKMSIHFRENYWILTWHLHPIPFNGSIRISMATLTMPPQTPGPPLAQTHVDQRLIGVFFVQMDPANTDLWNAFFVFERHKHLQASADQAFVTIKGWPTEDVKEQKGRVGRASIPGDLRGSAGRATRSRGVRHEVVTESVGRNWEQFKIV